MAKYYSREKAVTTFLSSDRLYKFSIFARSHSGVNLDVVTNSEDRCYTRQDYWYGTSIVLGRNFYSTVFGLDDKIPVLEIREQYKHMAMCYIAVFYHEFFHLMYTDMDYMHNCFRRMEDDSFVEFAHMASNILEDATIEGTGFIHFPYSKPYLNTLNKALTRDSIIESVSEQIQNDPKNPGTLLNFLLILAKKKDVSMLPHYALYEDNKEFINWGVYKCVNTINAQMRFNRQIAFIKQLIKILNLEAPDKSEVENPGAPGKGGKGPGSISKKAKEILTSISNTSQKVHEYNEVRNNPRTTIEDLVDEDLKDLTENKAERGSAPSVNDGVSGFDNTDLTSQAITTLANNEPVVNYSHKARRIDEFKNTSGYTSQYVQVVKRYEEQIRKVVAQIRKMKGQNRTSWNKFQLGGHFDVASTRIKGNYKYFKTKNAPSKEADLVFEILVDNSGSMSGKKSKLAGEALIIFAEALNRLHIPFAVDAFTEGRECITIKLKEFSDSYSKVKTNMTLLTEQFEVRDLATFCGNIDEVNLMYVRDILLQQRQQDKVCIVISDGATCGSYEVLKRVANNMEEQGITVLGIGVFDNNVEKIYKNHTVLRTQQDLEGLGVFLNKYLVRKIFK